MPFERFSPHTIWLIPSLLLSWLVFRFNGDRLGVIVSPSQTQKKVGRERMKNYRSLETAPGRRKNADKHCPHFFDTFTNSLSISINASSMWEKCQFQRSIRHQHVWPPTSSKFKAENNRIENLSTLSRACCLSLRSVWHAALPCLWVSYQLLNCLFLSQIYLKHIRKRAEQQSLHQVEQEEI